MTLHPDHPVDAGTAQRPRQPVDAIVAVHANAHYTYVFDGTTTPLSHAFTIVVFRSGFTEPRPNISEFYAHILSVDSH